MPHGIERVAKQRREPMHLSIELLALRGFSSDGIIGQFHEGLHVGSED
jgi:hypothetical protein